LEKLQLVAHEPLTYVAFLVLVGAWLWREYFLRTKDYLVGLKTLPKRDQLSGLQLLALGYPQKVTTSQLKLLQQRYFLVAFVATLVCIIILAGLMIHYWSLPADEIKKRLGQIEEQGNSAAHDLTLINEKLSGVLAQNTQLLLLVAEYREEVKKTSEPPPPPREFVQVKNSFDGDLESLRKQLSDYARLYGKLPHPQIQAQIDQAEQTARAAGELLPGVTLNNSFIERYKDRATVTTNFLVDKMHRVVNSPRNDGDIHIAGRSDDLGFTVVAEIMNAKDEQHAIDALREVEGTSKSIRLTGVWRIWFESAGIEPHIQGNEMTPAQSTNPRHVFEIHPVTMVETTPLLKSLRLIEGFRPKDANGAFSRFESLRCKISPTSATTTLSSDVAGYNYVEFVLEANAAAREIEDGWLLPAKVYANDGAMLVRSCRMVFVKDTGPAEKVAGLKAGNRLRAPGTPRINLAEVGADSQKR
jgi:hypothetical protein